MSADHVDVGQRVDLQHVFGIPPQSSHQKPNFRKKTSPPAADKSAQPAEPSHTKRKKQYTSRRTYPAYQTYQVARPAPQSRGWYGASRPTARSARRPTRHPDRDTRSCADCSKRPSATRTDPASTDCYAGSRELRDAAGFQNWSDLRPKSDKPL